MTKLNVTRRFVVSLGFLILIAVPLACNSESPARPSSEPGDVVAAPPADAPASARSSESTPSMVATRTPAADVDGAARAVDRDVRETAGTVEAEAGQVQGEVKRAVGETREDAKETAGQVKKDLKQAVEGVKDETRKSAEEALDNLLGQPKP